MRLRPIPIFALGALAAALIAGCRVNRNGDSHEKSQILYSATLGDPKTFNPILVTDTSSGGFIGNLFTGLVKDNYLTLLPEPDLAERWDISADQKTITFHLRHGVKWSDGAPFTARDVMFTMRLVYDPKIPNILRDGLMVDGKPLKFDAPDDYTVVVTMPRVFAPLLYSIGVSIVPEHILKPVYEAGKFNQSWGIDTPPGQLIGIGQYVATRYVPSQVAQYDRNDGYWRKDEQGRQLPYLHGETSMIVPDANTMYLRFLAGQIDVHSPRPEEVVDLKEKVTGLRAHLEEIGIDTGTLFFCFNRNPRHFVKHGVTDPKLKWFTDLVFLRAMAHAVDKQGIINLAFHGLAVAAVQDISPANKIFSNPNLADYDYDLKEAAEILEAAGYHLGKSGFRTDPSGNRLEFNLMTNTGNPERDQTAVIFKQDVESLGIKVNYRPVDFVTLVERLDSNFDWDCVLIGFTGGIEPNNGADFYRSSGHLHMWNPDQPQPATPWEAEIDTLLDQGTAVIDPYRRAPYYWKIQEILHDQLPVIQTVRQTRYAAWKDSLINYRPMVWGLYRPEWIEFKEQ